MHDEKKPELTGKDCSEHRPRKRAGAEIPIILGLALIVAVLTFFLPACSNSDVPVPPGKEKWEVVIIGSGAGGLSAGATLSKDGVKTLILEQHDKPGGYMTAFERGDYRFEVSLHMIDGLDEGGMTRDLFEKLDILRRVKPVKFDPLYRSVHPDITLDVPADVNEYISLLKKTFPHESEGIDRLFQAFFAIGEDVLALNRLMDRFFLLRWITYPLVPIMHWDFVRNFTTTTDTFVDRYISDPKAISVILQLGNFMGVPPSRSPAVLNAIMLESYHHYGVYHFIGGSQAVANALVEVIEENGGEVRLDTRVEKILIENGRAVGVRTKTGEIYADVVISNANGYATYLELVGEEHLKPAYVEKVKRMEPGVSVTEVFLGLDLDLKEVGLGDIGEIFYSPLYEIEDTWEHINSMDVEKMSQVIALFSNTDPTSAPAGKSVVILTSGGNYEWENRWRIDQGYDAYVSLKESVADRMITVAEQFIPGLRDAIEEMEIATPLTMERYTSNYKGSIIGWAPTPEQSFLKRMKQKGPIQNLYLAGAWTFPAGGQSACLFSGYLTAKMVLKKVR